MANFDIRPAAEAAFGKISIKVGKLEEVKKELEIPPIIAMI
jgi:hypothetical protein